MKIVDFSAGNRAMWFDKNDPRVTFLDIRPCRNPDIVCDTTKLPPEVGDDFDLVVFDPPHENLGKNSHMTDRYGHWTRKQIVETITGSAVEAHRITKPGALMAFKWNDHAYSIEKVLGLMETYWEPLFGSFLRKGATSKTQSYWVLLLRKDL